MWNGRKLYYHEHEKNVASLLKFTTIRNMEELEITVRGPETRAALQTILLGNRSLRVVDIQFATPQEQKEEDLRVLRTWARSQPPDLVHLKLCQIPLDAETCESFAAGAPGIQHLKIYVDSFAKLRTLIAPMLGLRTCEVLLDNEESAAADIIEMLNTHPQMTRLYLFAGRPTFCSFYEIPRTPELIDCIRKHGAIVCINNVDDSVPDLVYNSYRYTADYNKWVNWRRIKIAVVGDPAPLPLGSSKLHPPPDDLVGLLAKHRTVRKNFEKVCSWSYRQHLHFDSPDSLVENLGCMPRAALDPVFNPVFNCRTPDEWRECYEPDDPWRCTPVFTDLRGVDDPDLAPYAGVIVVVDVSTDFTPKRVARRCADLRALYNDRFVTYLLVAQPGDPTPKKTMNARVKAHVAALDAEHKCIRDGNEDYEYDYNYDDRDYDYDDYEYYVDDDDDYVDEDKEARDEKRKRAETPLRVCAFEPADIRRVTAAELREAARHTYAPEPRALTFRQMMAAERLLRAHAGGAAAISAAEWSDRLDACGVDAADGDAILGAVSLRAPFRAIRAGGAVLLLRDGELREEAFDAYFAPRAPCAMRALHAARLFRDRTALHKYRDGELSAAMVAELYAAALVSRGRADAAAALPPADEMAPLLAAAGLVERRGDAYGHRENGYRV